MLQGGPQTIDGAIQCIKPYEAISFQLTATNYPVYMRNSIYNTNPNFDYGAFVQLQTKMENSGLNLDTFGFTFVNTGVFVFGNAATPDRYQTIVKVTTDPDIC